MKALLFAAVLAVFASTANAIEASWPHKVHYRYSEALGKKIFYRESGEMHQKTIVLLHGYPSSSHTYRELIPLLSGRYHVIAPDNIGSGFSDKPDAGSFPYNFDVLTNHVDALLTTLNIDRYVLYMQDFGAPVGFRLMMMRPDRVEAVIAQNANAYLDGIPPEKQNFFNQAQTDKTEGNIAKLFAFTGPEAIKHEQYLRDVKDRPHIMSPDTWTHDGFFLSEDNERHIQVKLFQDYKTNLDSYPKWQEFMRRTKFPLLLLWGKNDPVFTTAGAHAYLKDLPNAELHLLDAGHFAVEEKAVEIAQRITHFLGYENKPGSALRQIQEPVEKSKK